MRRPIVIEMYNLRNILLTLDFSIHDIMEIRLIVKISDWEMRQQRESRKRFQKVCGTSSYYIRHIICSNQPPCSIVLFKFMTKVPSLYNYQVYPKQNKTILPTPIMHHIIHPSNTATLSILSAIFSGSLTQVPPTPTPKSYNSIKIIHDGGNGHSPL